MFYQKLHFISKVALRKQLQRIVSMTTLHVWIAMFMC